MSQPDFAALLAEESAKHSGYRLRVDVILDELDDDTRRQVEEALRSNAKASALSRALGRLGHPVSEAAIRRWRADGISSDTNA